MPPTVLTNCPLCWGKLVPRLNEYDCSRCDYGGPAEELAEEHAHQLARAAMLALCYPKNRALSNFAVNRVINNEKGRNTLLAAVIAQEPSSDREDIDLLMRVISVIPLKTVFVSRNTLYAHYPLAYDELCRRARNRTRKRNSKQRKQ